MNSYSSYILFTIVIVLLSHCASTVGADDCGGHGTLDGSNECVCFSGYAPSSTADLDCDVAVPESCSWQNSSSTFTGGAAHINSTNTQFSSNTLTLYIESPVVINRTSTTISIGGSNNPACIYPGPNFQKTLDGCNDAFVGQIPWTSNSLCNFTEDDSDPDFIKYTAPIYITSSEVSALRGHQITQTQTDVLHVVVQFQKEISISTNTEVDAPVNMFSAVTDQSFTPSTGRGSISFATSLEWPFYLTAGSISSVPSGLTVFGSGLNNDTQTGDCSSTINSTCFQEFDFQVDPGSVCQLTGLYVIDYTIACRGNQTLCPLDSSTNSAVLTLSLQSSDFCAAVQTGITATGQIATYEDVAHTTPKAAFFTGQTGYFLVQVSSAQADVSSTTIDSISVSISGTPTTLYTSAGGIANAALSGLDSPQADTAAFAVDFTSTLFVVPTDQELQYSFTVEVSVAFQGNTGTKKRAIFTGGDSTTTRATASVSLQSAGSNIQGQSNDATTSRVTYALTALLPSLLLLCMF